MQRHTPIAPQLLLIATLSTTPATATIQQPDTTHTTTIPNNEYKHIFKTTPTTSPHPIKIQTKGHALLITSQHTQMLPIYKANGILYALFPIEKGTNWINGLPKGTYLINNRKITIS